MGYSMDPVCRKQGRAHLTALCAFCNERGHQKYMVKMEPGIVLREDQKGKLNFKGIVKYGKLITASLLSLTYVASEHYCGGSGPNHGHGR
jgi:hypothetical protein